MSNLDSTRLREVLDYCRKWRSQITIEGVTQYLGLFETAQQAHEAYVSVKRQVHEGCTL